MVYKGKIVRLNPDGRALVEVNMNINEVIHKDSKMCYVEPVDSRPLSDKQRNMCYALIGEIADWAGYTKHEMKEWAKLEFTAEHTEELADKIFSLANAPMSLVAAFQKFLVDFIISNDVPCKINLLEYADDIDNYVYMSTINKKCVICGRHGELHHVDALGMGADRKEPIHMGREVMCLCREHHNEIHDKGRKEFFSKYHLNGGVECDKTILKIYKLKG